MPLSVEVTIAASLCWLTTYSLSGAPAELGLEKELATENGWRAAKWGMTVQELSQAFGKEFQEEKRSKKAKDAKVAIRGMLKTRLPLDGLQYEVKFGFNPADRLNTVAIVCEKAKKESFGEVRQRLSELFGEMYGQERAYSMVGIKIDPYLLETFVWRQSTRRITFQSYEMKPNIFMTIRRFSVDVAVPDAEEDFGVKGFRRFSGEVSQIRERKAPRWCRLEVNPLKESLKVSCQKNEVIVDQSLTSEDRLQTGARASIGGLEVQELTLLIKGRPDPVRLSLGTDVVTLLQQTFPNQIQ